MAARGFSLWELICALAVAGVVLGLGTPSFTTLVLDMRRTADVNAFVTAIQLARSEAAKRAQPVVLCGTADGSRCGDAGLGFGSGWMVFVNEDDIRPPQRAPEEPLLLAYTPAMTGRIAANREIFEFRPFRQRSTNGTVTFCDRRGADAARAVIVSYTGRPRVSERGPDRPLTCGE